MATIKTKVSCLLLVMMAFIIASCNDDDDINGVAGKNNIEAVDLGLSVKWANANLGASNPWEIGYRYYWGEVEPRINFWGGYIYDKDDSASDDESYQNIGYEISGTKYDAARHFLGGKWRMPTAFEAYELLNKCELHPSQQGNTYGVTVIGPSGKSIFIPNCGWQDTDENDIFYKDEGILWTGSMDTSYHDYAFTICLRPEYSKYYIGNGNRGDAGIPIRAVID